jgi:hypothetical protein
MTDSSVVNGAGPLVEAGAVLDERQHAIRIAEQAAHAERMRRIELQEELARRRREQTEADVLRVDLAAARGRIREMNREREQLRREVAEAEHRVAVLASRAPPIVMATTPARPAESVSIDATRRLLAAERAMAANRSSPRRLSDRPAVAAVEAQQTIVPIEAGRLEAALSRLREAALAPEAAPPVGTVPTEPAAAGRAWIAPVFRAMVKRDPAGAGRLAVALLPAQPLVHPLPLAYDLVLSDLGCVSVIAAGGRAAVELRDAARPREQVQLVVRGELSSFARLLSAGPVRRRLVRRGLARARGSRSTLKALRGLIRAPLGLEQLRACGVCPSPAISLSLIAAMVQADWTKGETFTIAHREPDVLVAGACLRVRDAAPVVAGDPAECGVGGVGGVGEIFHPTTTIVCPSASLLAVFADAGGGEAAVEGESRPLAVVQSWVKRAHSG